MKKIFLLLIILVLPITLYFTTQKAHAHIETYGTAFDYLVRDEISDDDLNTYYFRNQFYMTATSPVQTTYDIRYYMDSYKYDFDMDATFQWYPYTALYIYDVTNSTVLYVINNVSYVYYKVNDDDLIFYSLNGTVITSFTRTDFNNVEFRHYLSTSQNGDYNSGVIDGYNQGRQEYGYYDYFNEVWVKASESFNVGFDNAKETYGHYNGSSWITADMWGDLEYNRGLTDDSNFLDPLILALTLPFSLMTIELYPGLKLGYFLLFPLLLGITSFFVYLVARRK